MNIKKKGHGDPSPLPPFDHHCYGEINYYTRCMQCMLI